jgi:O-methyltransferase
VKGLFEDTLPRTRMGGVALAHIDCDWYDPVLYCLGQVHSALAVGGFMILDDYNDWPGCKQATDDFCARQKDVAAIRTRPHAVLQKVR